MKQLLIVGPDSTLGDSYELAIKSNPDHRVESLKIPSSDYYTFELDGLRSFPPSEWEVCVAANEFYINDVRRALQNIITEMGYRTAHPLISPSAHIANDATIGEGSIIHAGCSVGARTVIGKHCVLRPNVVLSEDVIIGDYVTLEANTSARECSRVGDFTTICANSSLARGTNIGAHCYLNIPKQHGGQVESCTFHSPAFENPVVILPVTSKTHA